MSEVNDHREEFEQSMQEAFDGFSETADAFVWDGIEQALTEKKKSRAIVWWFSGAAASVALLVAATLLNPFGEQEFAPASTEPNNDLYDSQELQRENNKEIQRIGIDTNESVLPGRRNDESIANSDIIEDARDDASIDAGTNKGTGTGTGTGTGMIQSRDLATLGGNEKASYTDKAAGKNPTVVQNASEEHGGQDNALAYESAFPIAPEADEQFESLNEIPLLGIPSMWVINDSVEERNTRALAASISDGKEKKKKKKDAGDWIDWEEGQEKEESSFALLAHFSSSSGNSPSMGNSQSNSFLNESATPYGLVDQRSSPYPSYSPQKFEAPFVVGAKANISFSKRLSMETGWLFSFLSSSSTYKADTVGSTRYSYSENSQYIGIPILLQYRFIDKKKYSMYCSQGIMLDKGIANNLRLRITEQSGSESEERFKLDRPGVQGGLHFALGANYVITKTASFYVEPSVTSWLLNYNVPENVRNAQLIWPSLSLGIRFNL